MKVAGFNFPTTALQWAKGAGWAVIAAAAGVLATGGTLRWHAAGTAALVAFFAYLHDSGEKKESTNV